MTIITDNDEVAILRRICAKFKNESIIIRDELDSWGWRILRLKEFAAESYDKAGLPLPEEFQ